MDELRASSHRLAGQFPHDVEILPLGHSRQGDPIEALKIGNGAKTALVFAMPHPNEPIGSMMLESLSHGWQRTRNCANPWATPGT